MAVSHLAVAHQIKAGGGQEPLARAWITNVNLRIFITKFKNFSAVSLSNSTILKFFADVFQYFPSLAIGLHCKRKELQSSAFAKNSRARNVNSFTLIFKTFYH
jgi:hypothetical protein